MRNMPFKDTKEGQTNSCDHKTDNESGICDECLGVKTFDEQFDKKFNHDSPNGKAIVILDDTSQRPAQEELKRFFHQYLEDLEEEVSNINFYDWNEETQQMIKDKIKDSFTKRGI